MNYKFNKYTIKLVKDGRKTYDSVKVTSPDCLKSVCFEVLKLHEKAEEHFCLVTLDSTHTIIGVMTCSIGLLNSSQVHPREIYKRALLDNACAVIFIHNHPSGNLRPSLADISVTNTLIEAGKILGVKALDHIICTTNKEIFSFRDNSTCDFD